jgi:hypothetical protein
VQTRASLAIMAQRWLELSERSELAAWEQSVRQRAIQEAIGRELKTLYELPDVIFSPCCLDLTRAHRL